MIWSAHAVSAAAFAGWQLKMSLRLAVSERPVTFDGPRTANSMMCGGVVLPALAVPFDASDHSLGLIRSSYGPSERRTNDTETFCCPALIAIGSVWKLSRPSGVSAEALTCSTPFS